MSEPKKRGRPKSDAGKKPRGPVLYVQLTDTEETALQAFMASHPVEPDRSAVGRKGLHMLLAKHGFWPPKSESK